MDQLSSDLASLKIDRSKSGERVGAARWFVWMLVVAGLTAGAAFAYPRLEAELFKTEVKTGTIVDVSPSLAVTSLTATGYVIAEHRSKIGTSIPGRIAALHVKEGSVVEKGDVLVELDAADHVRNVAAAHARMAAATAGVASAKAALTEVKLQLERQRSLLDKGAAARSVVEDLEARALTLKAQVATAEAELRAARAQLELAQVTLDRMTIRAPLSGTVLDKPLDVGEMVETHTPILELADLSSLIVEVDVPETRLALVKPQGPAEITLEAFPGKRRQGRVRELGKRVNRSKATIPVKVEFTEETSDVLPDMSARVSFLTEALDRAALQGPSKRVAPSDAVTQRDGRDVVFVVEDGEVTPVPVRTGEASEDGVELLDGPPAGTRVVVQPPATLAAGQRIKRKDE